MILIFGAATVLFFVAFQILGRFMINYGLTEEGVEMNVFRRRLVVPYKDIREIEEMGARDVLFRPDFTIVRLFNKVIGKGLIIRRQSDGRKFLITPDDVGTYARTIRSRLR